MRKNEINDEEYTEYTLEDYNDLHFGKIMSLPEIKNFFYHLNIREKDIVEQRLIKERLEYCAVAMPSFYYDGLVHVVRISPLVQITKRFNIYKLNSEFDIDELYFAQLLNPFKISDKSISGDFAKNTLIGLSPAIGYSQLMHNLSHYQNDEYPHLYCIKIPITVAHNEYSINIAAPLEFYFPLKYPENILISSNMRDSYELLQEIISPVNNYECFTNIQGKEMIVAQRESFAFVLYSEHCFCCARDFNIDETLRTVNSVSALFGHLPVDNLIVPIPSIAPSRVMGMLAGNTYTLPCCSILPKQMIQSMKNINPEIFEHRELYMESEKRKIIWKLS